MFLVFIVYICCVACNTAMQAHTHIQWREHVRENEKFTKILANTPRMEHMLYIYVRLGVIHMLCANSIIEIDILGTKMQIIYSLFKYLFILFYSSKFCAMISHLPPAPLYTCLQLMFFPSSFPHRWCAPDFENHCTNYSIYFAHLMYRSCLSCCQETNWDLRKLLILAKKRSCTKPPLKSGRSYFWDDKCGGLEKTLMIACILLALSCVPTETSTNTDWDTCPPMCSLTWSRLSSCPVLLQSLPWACRTGVYPAPLCLCSLSCRPWFSVLWGYITPDNTVQTHTHTGTISVEHTLSVLVLWLTVFNTC